MKIKEKNSSLNEWKKNIRKNYELYLLSIPTIVLVLIFSYFPMYGIQLAFKDFVAIDGITGSPWVGFEHFERLFRGYNFTRIIKNTLTLSLYTLAVGFPLPLIFAIMLNEVKLKRFKKTLQMVSYAPNFISTVVLVSMITIFFNPNNGIINKFIIMMGGEKISFMTEPAIFKHLYVWSGVWQTLGWNAIIYMSALSGVDPQLYEAAVMDGANKLQKIWVVDIPCILPTAVILLILNCGSIMNVGFDKAFLMQNDLNREASDIISTYVYRVGIQGAEYSFSTAVSLFNSVINFILLITVNTVAKKVTDNGLW